MISTKKIIIFYLSILQIVLVVYAAPFTPDDTKITPVNKTNAENITNISGPPIEHNNGNNKNGTKAQNTTSISLPPTGTFDNETNNPIRNQTLKDAINTMNEEMLIMIGIMSNFNKEAKLTREILKYEAMELSKLKKMDRKELNLIEEEMEYMVPAPAIEVIEYDEVFPGNMQNY